MLEFYPKDRYAHIKQAVFWRLLGVLMVRMGAARGVHFNKIIILFMRMNQYSRSFLILLVLLFLVDKKLRIECFMELLLRISCFGMGKAMM